MDVHYRVDKSPPLDPIMSHLNPFHALAQGWANFFVGGPNEKSKMSGGPT